MSIWLNCKVMQGTSLNLLKAKNSVQIELQDDAGLETRTRAKNTL